MSLKLDKITMVDANCLEFSLTNKTPINKLSGYNFDYRAQTKANVENNLIFIELIVGISGRGVDKEKEEDVKVGSFEFAFAYRVDNLDEMIQVEDTHKRLDKTLHMSLLGITLSTTRGIILEKTANTILDKAYLPIVNPATLFDPTWEL